MQFPFLSTVCAALIVAATRVAANSQTGFYDSCDGLSLADGHILFATCWNTAGTATVSSSVDLNQCVGNIGGTLECWPNGNYYNSCNSCKLQNGDILSCDCGSGTTLKELNNCVSNRNGQLTCP